MKQQAFIFTQLSIKQETEKQENLLYNSIRYKIKMVVLLVGLPFFVISQEPENLVLNPGFEEFVTDSCNAGPSSFNASHINHPKGWFSMTGTGSPGFFSDCISSYSNLESSVPSNIFGYQEVNQGGKTYAFQGSFTLAEGFIFNGHLSNYNGELVRHIFKEPITGTFRSRLQVGRTYYIEFYVSSCQNHIYRKFSTDAFDIILHTDSVTYPIAQEPYISQSDIVWSNPKGNIINDTVNWTKLSGCFTAKGDEKYFSFGSFRDTSLIEVEGYVNGVVDGAAYYYDDFLIYQCDTCCPDQYPVQDYITVNNTLLQQGDPVYFETFLNKGNTANLYLFDSAGRIVYQHYLSGTDNTHQIPISLAAGIYHYAMVTSEKKKLGGKIVVF